MSDEAAATAAAAAAAIPTAPTDQEGQARVAAAQENANAEGGAMECTAAEVGEAEAKANAAVDQAFITASMLSGDWKSTADMLASVRDAATFTDIGIVVLALDSVLRHAVRDIHAFPFDLAEMGTVIEAVRARIMSADPCLARAIRPLYDSLVGLLHIARLERSTAQDHCLDEEGVTTICAMRGCTDPDLIATFRTWNASFRAWLDEAPRSAAERRYKILADGVQDAAVREALIAIAYVTPAQFDAYALRQRGTGAVDGE